MIVILRQLLKSSGKMINNPDWLKAKIKPYFHQISLDYIEKLVECMESIDIEEMDCDTYVELSFQADLPFHQKLIQFRSVRFLIRQIIHKI